MQVHKLTKGMYRLHPLTGCSRITLLCSDGSVYHVREMPDMKYIDVAIHHADSYTVDTECVILPMGEIKPSEINIQLPTAERWRLRPVEIVYNPDLEGTPARIFTTKNPAIIEVGDYFYTLPKQQRYFILLHEFGHLFYTEEWKVDRFALKVYLLGGYNQSQAFYALSKVLGSSEQSKDRINRIFNTLTK
jgi:hypothetical protein